MRVLAVVPAYNERARIGGVIYALRSYVDEILVIDDGSTDTTAEVAMAAGAKVVSHTINRGQGAALETGFTWARRHRSDGVDIVVTFDADDQHNPADIPALLKPLLLGEVEVALGNRFLSSVQIPRSRKFVLYLAGVLTKILFGKRFTDSHNGLRAISANALQVVSLRQRRMAHATEFIGAVVANNLSYREVPVVIKYTAYSKAKGQRALLGSIRILRDLIMARLIK